jgi:hypothetical protein
LRQLSYCRRASIALKIIADHTMTTAQPKVLAQKASIPQPSVW